MKKERILHLFKAYQQQTATEAEELEFSNLLHDKQYEEIFNEILDKDWEDITEQELHSVEFSGNDRILNAIKQNAPNTSKRIKLWPRIVAAAAILLAIVSTGLYFFSSSKKSEEIYFANDIAPGKNGATLTLANGRRILISDAINGDVVNEGGVKVHKNKEGQLIYEINEENQAVLGYHTLTTTRGEQIQVRLPDETLVFLNAESSLKFPTSFAKTAKRTVALEGEGYFEVFKDKQHPFVVENKLQTVEVLGTSFNINSYTDEPNIKTTLLEGSVRITNLKTKVNALLIPGQQAIISGDKLATKTVETEDIVDWKNGYFMFNNETLANILKKVSKWYDVEIIYKDGTMKNKTFFGSISRYGKISELLTIIQKTEVANFEIKGKQVIVSAEK